MSLFKCFIYYVGLVILLFLAEKIKKKHLYLGLLVLCVLLILRFPKPLTITCLSVGQGDSAVIEYKDFVCVIDDGSSSEKEVTKYTILPFLKYRGIREIDYLFLTHADSDHINGVEELLSQSRLGIQVKRIVVTDAGYLDEYGEILELATALKIPIYEMKQGDFVSYKELEFKCLGPSEKNLANAGESSNETSLVLLLEKDDFSMLFTGDTEGKGEDDVLNRLRDMGAKNLTVLKVAHHGSQNSTSDEFLGWVMPQISIISCGENNSYGHPHKETLQRLEMAESTVFVTKDCGAVTLRIGRKMKVRGYLLTK